MTNVKKERCITCGKNFYIPYNTGKPKLVCYKCYKSTTDKYGNSSNFKGRVSIPEPKQHENTVGRFFRKRQTNRTTKRDHKYGNDK